MVKNLKIRKQLQTIERCPICGNLDKILFFDIDHKIPTCIGGPNARWNVWPLCVRCHRAKCHYESIFFSHLIKKCFSCNIHLDPYKDILQCYTTKDNFWCHDCIKLPFHIRVLNLECTIKKNIFY